MLDKPLERLVLYLGWSSDQHKSRSNPAMAEGGPHACYARDHLKVLCRSRRWVFPSAVVCLLGLYFLLREIYEDIDIIFF